MKSKLILASLFKKGSLFVFKPLLVRFLMEPADETTIQAAFSVPKKRFKLAVDRNKLKRRLREAHRLQKHNLKDAFKDSQVRVSIIYIYNTSKPQDYQIIESAVVSFINYLMDNPVLANDDK